MDKEWIRKTAEERIGAIYGLDDCSDQAVEAMVDEQFSRSAVLQFPGFMELNPLFGCQQGIVMIKEHFKRFFATVEVLDMTKQYIIVDGFSADAHYKAKFKMKESGSIFDFECVILVDVDMEGRVRDLKLYFDTASFLKAVKAKDGEFFDAQESMPHVPFDPNSENYAGSAMSHMYNVFYLAFTGQASWDRFWELVSDDVEVVFKSNGEVLPYAGDYKGKDGFKQWFQDLFSIWSLNAFNFTKIYAEGNAADYMMHELHYYTNPDGSKRYLDVYIVQSFRVDADGKMDMFKSYNDSAWLDETFFVSEDYKQHYGYPENYPPAG